MYYTTFIKEIIFVSSSFSSSQLILMLVSGEDFTRKCAFVIAPCHLLLCCHSLQGFSAETALRL